MTGSVAAVAGDDLLRHVHVGSSADEGERDCVDAVAETEFEVLAVFFGQSRNRESDAGKIDPLMLAEQPAINNVADDIFAPHCAHAQFDQAVA